MDNTNNTVILEPIKSLINEFQDIFPSDLLNGLPHLRDIQQQIDLVSGSNPFNWPHNRMNPKEHEKLW